MEDTVESRSELLKASAGGGAPALGLVTRKVFKDGWVLWSSDWLIVSPDEWSENYGLNLVVVAQTMERGRLVRPGSSESHMDSIQLPPEGL